MCIENDPWTYNVDWNEISKQDQEWLKENYPELASDMIFRFPRNKGYEKDQTQET